ncbi:MAG: hypothetical protein GYB17_03905 [Gammaproteobacteria bacterium]|nr:hypothetical protein [Gammaproteobacteria bacterium]
MTASNEVGSLRERLEQVEAERDALAARNAELHDVAGILLCIDQCETCREEGEFNRDGVKRVINREPPASLARRDARMKAEALSHASDRYYEEHGGWERPGHEVIDFLDKCEGEYRQQAEGGGDE